MDEIEKGWWGEKFLELSIGNPVVYYGFALALSFVLARIASGFYDQHSRRDPEIARMTVAELEESKLNMFILIFVLTFGVAWFIRWLNS